MAKSASNPSPLKHLGEILMRAAEEFPRETAMYFQGKRFTFGEVYHATAAATFELQQCGLAANQKVALLIPNCPAFSIYYFAVLWTGAIIVPINPLLSFDETSLQLSDSESNAIVVCGVQAEKLHAIAQSNPKLKIIETELIPGSLTDGSTGGSLANSINDVCEFVQSTAQATEDLSSKTAAILYTSGTTGVPKGAELTHGNLLHNAEHVSEKKFSTSNHLNWLGKNDVALAALPLSHIFGQTNVQNGIWYHGGATSYSQKFNPSEIIMQLIADDVTFFPGVPTMFFELLEMAKSLGKPIASKLKYCVCGGASLPAKLKAGFEQFFSVKIQGKLRAD